MFKVDSISKSYGDVDVLKNISFELKKGDIAGFLGANGAGKTTLLKILAAYHMPDSGEVILNGVSIKEECSPVKSSIGYLSERTPLYEYMTVGEYIDFMILSMGSKVETPLEERQKLLKAMSLNKYEYTLISSLSSGYRQRCAIAGALAGDLSVLILDEPAKGLDPLQIADLRKIIRSFSRDRIVVISSHILSEVELLCDRVFILDEGTIKYDRKLKNSENTQNIDFRAEISGSEKQIRTLKSITGISLLTLEELEPHYWIIQIRISKEEYRENKALIITENTHKLGLKLHSLEKKSDSLEKIFLSVLEGGNE